MKLKTLIESQGALNKLLALKLPVKVAYKISKMTNRIQTELKIYEDQRIKLVKDLGEVTDEQTQSFKVKNENLDKFSEEITKLQDIEVDLGFGPDIALEKIKVEDLGEVSVEPNDLINLGWLIE